MASVRREGSLAPLGERNFAWYFSSRLVNTLGAMMANIALTFPEAYKLNINVLIATGLILFIVTFAVNAVARWIVGRRKEFSGAN